MSQSLQFNNNWCSAMTVCQCGDVFKMSGSTADVNTASREWNTKHADCHLKPRDPVKTFWLSFCDNDRPKGQRFLGACVVDVTAEEAEAMSIEVFFRFPFAQHGAEWIAAASRKAHALGCNPGGQVASAEIEQDNPMLRYYTRGVLMDRVTIAAIDKLCEADAS